MPTSTCRCHTQLLNIAKIIVNTDDRSGFHMAGMKIAPISSLQTESNTGNCAKLLLHIHVERMAINANFAG